MMTPGHDAVDCRLLEPLFALLEERHVTRAAERCGLGQPAMSRILARLRVDTADALLVRTGSGHFVRTPRGDEILATLRDVLPRVRTAVSGRTFDPRTTVRRFRIACTEGAALAFVPELVRRTSRLAPGIEFDVVAWDAASVAAIESGLVDLAIVGTAEVQRSLVTAPLVEDEFVCLVARDHPIAGGRVGLARYLRFGHVVLDVKDGGQPWIDDVLAARRTPRRVALRTPYVLSAVPALSSTESVLTVARRQALARPLASDVRFVGAPREFDRVAYGMAWHARATSEAAHRWLRDRLEEVASSIRDADASTTETSRPSRAPRPSASLTRSAAHRGARRSPT